MEKIPQVLECLLITGQDADYQLKVVVRDMDAYQEFLLNKITRIEGVLRTASVSAEMIALPAMSPGTQCRR